MSTQTCINTANATHINGYDCSSQDDDLTLESAHVSNTKPDGPDMFDYIVVGAGASGTVIAAKLAQQAPSAKILLLDAGRDHRAADMSDDMASQNPMALWGDKQWTWPQVKVARTASQAPRDYPTARCVGGGSSINGMGWIWGQRADFDEWEQLYGCRGWGWRNNMERIHHAVETDPLHAGSKGPIQVTRTRENDWGTVSTAMRKAAQAELGFPWCEDLNAEGSTGVSPFPLNWDTSLRRRSSVNEVYLEPCRHRRNLTVRGNCVVHTLIFSKDDPHRVVGVKAFRTSACVNAQPDKISGQRYMATREVLLCAGPIFTPSILQRSGLGPRDLLERLNIPCRRDTPVGHFVQDHPVINGTIALKSPAAAAGSRHANALARFSSGGPFNDLYFVSVDACNDPRLDGDKQTQHLGFVDVMLMKCCSRGRVEIVSKDNPLAPPRVSANMLSDPVDCARLRFGVRKLATLLQSAHFSDISATGDCAADVRLGRKGGEGEYKSCDEVLGMSNSDLDDWMKCNASDGIHVSCSVPMGIVVDANGKFSGLNGLRVCDASVMPTVVRANTHATTICIGHMMSDRILSAYTASNQGLLFRPLDMYPTSTRMQVASWLFEEWPEENKACGVSTPASLGEELLTGDFDSFVLTDTASGAIVGTARLSPTDLESHDAHCTPWLAAVFVPKVCRGRGYGRLLVQGVISHATRLGHKKLFLWFPSDKETFLQPFYLNLGFKLMERTRNDHSSFDHEVIVMCMSLKSG